jgi:hypothetical protein
MSDVRFYGVLLTVPAPVIAERGVGGSFFFFPLFASSDTYFPPLACRSPTLDDALTRFAPAFVVFAT